MPLQKDLLKQVLFNLAKNAVEAMPSGGHLKFTTRLIDANGQREIEIEVADTGPGLPAAVGHHVRTGSQRERRRPCRSRPDHQP